MSNQQEILINCDGDGITVQTKGFKGQGCDAIHKAFAEAGKVTSHKKTPEYYDRETARIHVPTTVRR